MGLPPKNIGLPLKNFVKKVIFPCSPLKNSIFFVSTPNGILHKLTPEETLVFNQGARGGGWGGGGERAACKESSVR